MMTVRTIALVFVAYVASASALSAHPIEKVIGLLKDLKEKAISEGKEEEVAFAKFVYWCKTSTSELQKAIKEEKDTIDSLESKIEGLKEEKKTLEGQIEELKEEIKDLDSAADAAKTKDKKRNTAYTAAKKDLKATIKAIGSAINTMQGASKTDSGLLEESAQNSIREALAFLSTKTTDEQQELLVNFVSADPKAMGDRKAHVKKYNFKSDNVIELLKELQLKFQDDVTAADTDETNGANQYALEKSARDNAKDAAVKSKNEKSKNLADVEGDLSEAEGDLKNEKADLEADEATLKSTDENCSTRNREWEERSETRAHEIDAITEGIRILAKVSGVRHETPDNPVLPSSPVFLQINEVVDPKQQAVNLLRQTAKTVHSKALEQLALEVSTHLTGPFDKVNDMVQKMIFRLMSEQTDEDKHKAWCDLEIEKSDTSKSDKEDKIKELDADLDAQKAGVQKLTNEISEADKMVADITDFMAEATEIRTSGKEENTVCISDAKKGQTALANAIAVLEDFYKSSGKVPKEDWEFVQDPVKLPKDPKVWDSPNYLGTDGSNSVITILKTTAADFSKMEAETKAQEVEDQKEYDDTMQAHKVEKNRRREESEAKLQEKKRKIAKIGSLNQSLKHTNDDLDGVKKYIKDLQPACVEGDSTYADRKAARSKEIEALKSAQKTLRSAFKGASFLEIRRHE